MKAALFFVLLILFAGLMGCAEKLAIVKPYEKEYFSQDKMLYSPMPAKVEQEGHVFLIREASAGGESSFQGGCGCR